MPAAATSAAVRNLRLETPDIAKAVETRVAPLPRNLLDAMREAGVDPGALAQRLGIDAERLDTGLDFADLDRFFCAAWEELDDPAFGLRAGCYLRPERFGVVGIIVMSSPTLGVAFERKARYGRLVWGDVYEVQRRGAGATVRIASSLPPRPYSQARIDLELATLATLARRFTDNTAQPQRVTLRQAPPGYRERYTQVFGCPIVFEQPDDAIQFRAQDLELPLVSANADIGPLLIGTAESRLEHMDAGGGELRSRVSQAVRRLLHGDEPTLAAVAAELHLSERTLQRRLAEQKLHFTELLDAVRRESALQYLREKRVSVDEVAFLLGFATPSSSSARSSAGPVPRRKAGGMRRRWGRGRGAVPGGAFGAAQSNPGHRRARQRRGHTGCGASMSRFTRSLRSPVNCLAVLARKGSGTTHCAPSSLRSDRVPEIRWTNALRAPFLAALLSAP